MRTRGALTGLAAAALVLAAALGCGGGGGGGPTAPPPPQPGITFTPSGAAGSNSVHLAAGSSTNRQRLLLEVRVSGVTDLYGLSFDLEYPTDQLDWDAAAITEGTFLSEDGAVATSLLVTERPDGNLIVGFTRLGDVAGIEGTDLLFTLEFTSAGAGSGSLSFSRNAVFGADGSEQDDVTWVAGSVNVVV